MSSTAPFPWGNMEVPYNIKKKLSSPLLNPSDGTLSWAKGLIAVRVTLAYCIFPKRPAHSILHLLRAGQFPVGHLY